MGDYKIIPEAYYKMKIEKIERKESQKSVNGNAIYTSLTIEVIEGEFKGRKLWKNLNLINPNEKAVAMALKDQTAIFGACNKLNLQECIGVVFLGKIVQIPDYRDKTKTANEVKDFMAVKTESKVDVKTQNNEAEIPF